MWLGSATLLLLVFSYHKSQAFALYNRAGSVLSTDGHHENK